MKTYIRFRSLACGLMLSPVGLLLESCDSNKKSGDSVSDRGILSNSERSENQETSVSDTRPRTSASKKLGESSAEKYGAVNRSAPEYEALGREFMQNPDKFKNILSEYGPGRNRRDFIQRVLHEFSINLAIPIETSVSLLETLDKLMYEEDVHAIRPSDVQRLVERMGLADTFGLVAKLQSTSIKRDVLDAVGRKYADQGTLPSIEQLSILGQNERNVVYSTIGEEISFISAEYFTQFLEGLDQEQIEYKTLANSALSDTRKLDPLSLVEAAIKSNSSMVSSQVFDLGFKMMMRDDSMRASEYLALNKSNLNPDLYRIGVRRLLEYLEQKGASDEAVQWKEQLGN